MLKRTLSSDSVFLEVVEDSEPEREAARKREQGTRKYSKLQRLASSSSPQHVQTMESRNVAGVETVQAISEVLDLSDDGAQRYAQLQCIKGSAESSKTCEDSTKCALQLPSTNPRQSLAVTDSALNLRRFAFGMPKNGGLTTASSRDPPTRSASSTSLLPGKLSKSKSSADGNSQYLGFSQNQIGLLLTCVSCDAKWTSRKSTPQKIAHMKGCAKNGRLTEETMTTLLDRALAHASRTHTGKKTKRPCPEETSKTLFQDVVQGSGASKKSCKRKVDETIRRVTDTRDEILDRARAMLDEHNTEEQTPPATQHFSKSRVAPALAPPERRLATASDDGTQSLPECNAPTPTQFLPESRIQSRLLSAAVEGRRAQRKPALFEEDSESDIEYEMNGVTRHSTLCRVDCDTNDSAVLHFDGMLLDISGGDEDESDKFADTTNGEANSFRKKHKGDRQDHTSGADLADDCANVSDAEMDSRLEGLIKSDKELHLRILRFEPISFDVFMKLLERKGQNTRGIKPKLHSFLDKHAISFYDATSNGRTRH